MVSRRSFLAAAGLSALLLRAQQSKPNIVFVMADDLGYGDLDCYGQKRLTSPNIDRLASEGMRFTDAYAGSTVCAPSRSCLMTGLHTGHTRIRSNGRYPLQPGDTTVAQALQRAGYKTGAFGKWSLGEAGTGATPNEKGFDEFYGYINQGHAHNFYPENLWHNDRQVFLSGNRANQRGDYSHDLVFQHALDFVEKVAGEPFFLYLPITVPHANNELGRATGDGMEVPDYGEYAGEQWPNPEKGFAAMLRKMDDDVGRLMKLLKGKGVDGDTLVIFTSDNGPHREGGHEPEFFGSQGGLRGIKRDFYEGGIRVPAIARWPGKVPAGVTSDQPWAFWDFFPTACEAAGVDPPKGLDGVSILPTLQGKKQKEGRLYWEILMGSDFMQAARLGRWKGVRYSREKPIEIYDLAEDLGETRNLAGEKPNLVKEFETIFREWRTESKEFPSRRSA